MVKKHLISDLAGDLQVGLAMDFDDMKAKVEAGEEYTYEAYSHIFGHKVTYHITIQRE